MCSISGKKFKDCVEIVFFEPKLQKHCIFLGQRCNCEDFELLVKFVLRSVAIYTQNVKFFFLNQFILNGLFPFEQF